MINQIKSENVIKRFVDFKNLCNKNRILDEVIIVELFKIYNQDYLAEYFLISISDELKGIKKNLEEIKNVC